MLTETVNHVSTFAKILGAGTYSELIWALVIVVVRQIVLTFTRWGLYTVAVGSNKLGAAEAGVQVRLVMIRNFILCAAAGGFVGILEAVRACTVQPDVAGANEILFLAIAAAVIGGTLLAGGSGTVVGALIGALFLGILHDGLILKGVNADYQLLYLGLAIILAMTVNDVRAARAQGATQWLISPSTAETIVGPRLGAGRRAARRTHRQALRAGDGAARRQPAPAQGRGAGPAGRQRRRQVDADQDHQRLPEAGLGQDVPARPALRAEKRRRRARQRHRHRLPGPGADRRTVGLPQPVPAPREGAPSDPVPGQQADEARSARGAGRDRHQHPPHRRGGGAPVGRPAPGDRGRAHGELRRRTSSCSTSRWRRWAPRRARRSSIWSPA